MEACKIQMHKISSQHHIICTDSQLSLVLNPEIVRKGKSGPDQIRLQLLQATAFLACLIQLRKCLALSQLVQIIKTRIKNHCTLHIFHFTQLRPVLILRFQYDFGERRWHKGWDICKYISLKDILAIMLAEGKHTFPQVHT